MRGALLCRQDAQRRAVKPCRPIPNESWTAEEDQKSLRAAILCTQPLSFCSARLRHRTPPFPLTPFPPLSFAPTDASSSSSSSSSPPSARPCATANPPATEESLEPCTRSFPSVLAPVLVPGRHRRFSERWPPPNVEDRQSSKSLKSDSSDSSSLSSSLLSEMLNDGDGCRLEGPRNSTPSSLGDIAAAERFAAFALPLDR